MHEEAAARFFDPIDDSTHRQYKDHEYMWNRQQNLDNVGYDALHEDPWNNEGKKIMITCLSTTTIIMVLSLIMMCKI